MLLMLKSYTKKAVQKLDFGLRSASSQYLPVTVNLTPCFNSAYIFSINVDIFFLMYFKQNRDVGMCY